MAVMNKVERIVPVSALRDNYIWAICAANRCVAVDPGEATPLRRFLADEGLCLAAILLTHRHADHQGAAAELASDGIPVYGPPSEAMPCVTHPLHDSERFSLEGFDAPFEVLAVPGHTEEHIAFLHAGHLFCGDTLFAAGCGRLLGGNAAQLLASLKRLAGLPPDTAMCCAHEYTLANLRFALAAEPDNSALHARITRCEALRAANQPTLPSRLAEELATNPFLRSEEATVRQALEGHWGASFASPLERFAALRRWKDQF